MTDECHHLLVMSSSLYTLSSNDDDPQSRLAEERAHGVALATVSINPHD